MRNHSSRILTYIILAILSAACKHSGADPEIAVTGISLNEAMISLEIGQTFQLSATISPANATDQTISWRSSQTSVATVSDNGLITAIGAGTASITATSGSVSTTCEVSVNKPFIEVSSISMDRRSLILPVGSSKEISVSVLPEDATDPSVEWSTSDPEIASVSNGEISAIKEGTATIVAKAGDKEAKCEITVIPYGPESSEIWYTSWTGKELNFGSAEGCGAGVISNEYSDGKGVITFDGDISAIPTSLFKGNSGLRTVSLPHTVKSLSLESFCGCSTLLHINIQEGLEVIGGNSFDGCSSLREIILPSSVTKLGNYVIRNCDLITTVTVPENVTTLEAFALYGCTSLTSIKVLSEKPATLGFRALDETGDCPIYVPADAIETYKNADGWKSYASRITAAP